MTADLVAFLREMLHSVDTPRAERLLGVDNEEARRQLDDIDAKRRIIDHIDMHGEDDHILRFLALPFAGHEDYQEAWRP